MAGNIPDGTTTRRLERAVLCLRRMDGTLAPKTMIYQWAGKCAKTYAVSCTTLEFEGVGVTKNQKSKY